MKRTKTKILTHSLLISLCALSLSCNEHTEKGQNYSKEIHFEPSVSSETRATYFSSDNLSSVGILAYYTGSSDFVWANKSPNFMKDQLVRRVSLSSWIYSPTRYWPASSNDKLTFFSYAPHSSTLAQTDGSIITDTTTTQPSLIVTIPSRQKKQADVLVSYPLFNKTLTDVDNGLLPLSFTHVLSSIDFHAQCTAGTLVINSVKTYYTSNVKRRGNVSLSTGTWLSGTLQGSYSTIDGATDARKDTIVSSNISVGTSSTALTNSSSHLLLIPQSLSIGDIKVEIGYTLNGTASVKTVSLPAQTYTAGNNYPFLFVFGEAEQVFPIPLPSIPIGTKDMCGCSYDRVTNPHHNLSLPHYNANNSANNSWSLRANADWESSLQFKNKINFYIYGRYKVNSWWGSSSNNTLYVMPGGVLDLTQVSGMNTGMQIVNFGTVILPNNFSINAGASFTSASDLDAANTTLNIGGEMELYGNTSFDGISTYGNCIITINKCLSTNSLAISNNTKVYVNSYLHTGTLSMNTTTKVYLAAQSFLELDGNISLDYYASTQILNESSGYAVFKCANFATSVSNTSTMIFGRIDIHGNIQNNSGTSSLTWNSLIKLNGNTTITGDGCKPAFP